MVTESTGRPTAAIDIRAASRRRGRPLKPLHTNPDRYLYAEIQALISYHQQANDGISDEHVADTVIAHYYGTPVTTETIFGRDGKPMNTADNVSNALAGKPYVVYALPGSGGLKHRGKVELGASTWRNKTSSVPLSMTRCEIFALCAPSLIRGYFTWMRSSIFACRARGAIQL